MIHRPMLDEALVMAKQESFTLQDYGVVKFSLLQRHPEPYWNIRFRSPDGRRLERSTGKTSRGDALAEGSRDHPQDVQADR